MNTRFNIANPFEQTPPFVLWTLAHPCALREASDYANPEATERLLRSVRCYSDAVAEHRVHHNIVVSAASSGDAEPTGFLVEPVLEPFGGLDFITAQCLNCPANALAKLESLALAGCVGYLVPPEQQADAFHRLLDTLIEPNGASTTPSWYSLWLDSQPARMAIESQRELWCRYLASNAPPAILGLHDYLAALDQALAHDIPLRVQLYPAGRCAERRWIVAAHCGRCIAPWPEARRQQCRVCGQVGGRQPERTRRRMGTRPFRALREFLSSKQIVELLQR